MARTPTVSDAEILEATADVIERCGPNGFSLSEVATKVGLSRAAITLRFKSAQALKLTVLNHQVDQFAKWLDVPPESASGDNVLAISALIGEYIKSRESFSLFYINYSHNLIDPELAALETKRAGILFKVVSAAMPEIAIDRDEAVWLFLAFLTGSILAWQGSADDIDARTYLVQKTQQWLRLAGISFKSLDSN